MNLMTKLYSNYYDQFNDLLAIAKCLGTNLGAHPHCIEKALKDICTNKPKDMGHYHGQKKGILPYCP